MTHTPPLSPLAIALALLAGACHHAPSTPLGRAAHSGDVVQVRALLTTSSADASADGWSPLVWAARAGQVETMTLLLDAGADPNRPDGRLGWTPLMHALHKRRTQAARLLLARGADGTRGAGGTSPLEMAALDNDVEWLRILLAARPPRDQRLRAFDRAVSGGALADVDRPLLGNCHTEAVRLLLEADPDLARPGEWLGQPLWWARRQGCTDVIRRVTAANQPNLAQKTP
jgi:ankyrin repeat protein